MSDKNEHPAELVEQVSLYLRVLADNMGLRHWTFKVVEEPADPANLAEIDAVYGQCHALVYIAETWTDMEPDEQRATLVHELLHAHMAPLRDVSSDLLKVTGKHGAAFGAAALGVIEEYTVELIAQAWAPHLPLPVSPEPPAPKTRLRRKNKENNHAQV